MEQATKRNAEYLKAKQGDPATPPARHAHLLQLLDVLNTVTEAEGTGMGLPNTDDEPESTGDTAAAAAATASGETAGADGGIDDSLGALAGLRRERRLQI